MCLTFIRRNNLANKKIFSIFAKKKAFNMKIVMCIEKFEQHGFTFKVGEKYIGNAVNENYWVIESIGVNMEDFILHFEVIDELAEDNSNSGNTITNPKFAEEEKEFKQFLKEFGFIDNEDKDEKETWWDKFINYVFV